MVVRELVNLIGFKIDEKAFRNAEARVNQVNNKVSKIGRTMSIAFTAPFVALNVWVLKSLSDFEQLDIAFATMLGSTEKGKTLVKDMLQFAAETPFEIKEIGPTVKQLLAMGESGETVLDTLKDLGNVSAGLGVPVSRLALNFGQVRNQGKLTGRELRDFAVAGVPLLDTLAKQFDTTTGAVTKMVSAGTVGFNDVAAAFKSMAGAGGRFDNLMEKQAKTLGGRWSNFKDILTLTARTMEKMLLPIAKKLINTLIKLVDVFKNMSSTLKAIIFIFGGLLAVIGPLLLSFTLIVTMGKFVAGTFVLISQAATKANISTTMFVAKFALMGVAVLAVIAILILVAEDIAMFVQGQDSLVGKFMAPWSELAPKINAALAPFIIILQDMWNNIKNILTGIIDFTVGIFTNDVDKAAKGLELILADSLDFLANMVAMILPILWTTLKTIWSLLTTVIPQIFTMLNNMIATAIKSVFKTILAAFDKLFSTIKSKLTDSGVGKFFGNMFSSPAFGSGGLAMAGGGGIPSNIGNSLNSNKSINISATIQTFVPEGTPQYQADSLNETSRAVAQEVFNANINNLYNDIPEVE